MSLAKTINREPGVFGGRCSSCGVPLEAEELDVCGRCHATGFGERHRILARLCAQRRELLHELVEVRPRLGPNHARAVRSRHNRQRRAELKAIRKQLLDNAEAIAANTMALYPEE